MISKVVNDIVFQVEPKKNKNALGFIVYKVNVFKGDRNLNSLLNKRTSKRDGSLVVRTHDLDKAIDKMIRKLDRYIL